MSNKKSDKLTYDFNVVILGSGLAGLNLALRIADHKKVAIITKRNLLDGSSVWAQGGIAGVLSDDDSVENHIQDTLIAGAGLCNEQSVRFVVENSRRNIEWLINQGVPFTQDQNSKFGYHLTREGGHSQRRIIHAADATGRAVQETLMKRIKNHKNIRVFEYHLGIDLITTQKLGLDYLDCLGIYVFDQNTRCVKTFRSDQVVLSTGGAGKVYLYTTNPDVATGDGIAMGYRAGCKIANMEFIQFHPTCLYHPKAKSFLISEAVRGEGGLLKLPNGKRFMPQYDERAELAPRDIVARTIDFEMKKRGLDCVYLDISHQPKSFLLEHFPTIYAKCLDLGIDISRDPIPVVPAAHYTCGGIMTDLDGKTNISSLYAVGEVAHTGLHGANRLASNSLLECLVFGESASNDILNQPEKQHLEVPLWDESRVADADEEVVISHNWDELRRAMWDYVGIVRTTKRLERATHRIKLLKQEINEYYKNFRVSNDLIELRNLVTTADLIVQCAMQRQESRGLHYSKDYPNINSKIIDSIIHKNFS